MDSGTLSKLIYRWSLDREVGEEKLRYARIISSIIKKTIAIASEMKPEELQKGGELKFLLDDYNRRIRKLYDSRWMLNEIRDSYNKRKYNN